MSKKTKKQKMLADARRTLPPANVFKAENIAGPIQNTSLYTYPIHEIRKDLTKTILLCILAISFEIALYFFFKNNTNLSFR